MNTKIILKIGLLSALVVFLIIPLVKAIYHADEPIEKFMNSYKISAGKVIQIHRISGELEGNEVTAEADFFVGHAYTVEEESGLIVHVDLKEPSLDSTEVQDPVYDIGDVVTLYIHKDTDGKSLLKKKYNEMLQLFETGNTKNIMMIILFLIVALCAWLVMTIYKEIRRNQPERDNQ